MSSVRVMLYSFLLMSLVYANNANPDKKFGCKFDTCRDCVGGRFGKCVWIFFYSGVQKCVVKTGHFEPGVEAEADNLAKCLKPDCVLSEHDPWDLEGIAQLVGGLFGGFLGGYLGILGFRRVRQGRQIRAGYEQIGEGQTWRDVLGEFLGAFIGRMRRDNFVHVEDDRPAELRLRAAIQRRIQEQQRQRQQQQQQQEEAQVDNSGINQPGMGMQFDGGVVADEANAISPERPGIAGGAAIMPPPGNLTPGGRNEDLDSDDFDEGGEQ